MGRTRKVRGTLSVLLGLMVWSGAQAQQVGEGTKARSGGRTGEQQILVAPDSTRWLARGDASGNTMTREAFPAHTDFRDGSTAIIDDTTAVGMADSSIVINMGKYRLNALAFKVDPGAGAATPFARLAISVRFHLNSQSDSASIMPLLPRTNDAANADAPGDSLKFNVGAVVPTSVACSDREFIVTVQRDDLAAAKWGNVGTGFVNLDRAFLGNTWTPYISVRVRQIGGSGVCRQKWYLLGTPQ
jgi:hypothetical protein